MSVPYSLSIYDLLQIPTFKKAAVEGNRSVVNKVLWDNGLDVISGYAEVERLHRPLTSKVPFEGMRYEGVERSDQAWLKSGYASLDALCQDTDDVYLRDELLSLNPSNKQWEEDWECNGDLESIGYEMDNESEVKS
jgi:hypothetical protein